MPPTTPLAVVVTFTAELTAVTFPVTCPATCFRAIRAIRRTTILLAALLALQIIQPSQVHTTLALLAQEIIKAQTKTVKAIHIMPYA